MTSKVEEKAIMDRNPKFLCPVGSAWDISWSMDAGFPPYVQLLLFPHLRHQGDVSTLGAIHIDQAAQGQAFGRIAASHLHVF